MRYMHMYCFTAVINGNWLCRSAEVNETLVDVSGQYIAIVYDDVMPDYVTVGDGKNYSSDITNVSLISF